MNEKQEVAERDRDPVDRSADGSTLTGGDGPTPTRQDGIDNAASDDEIPSPTREEPPPPPDGGYGWVCTACAFTINAHTWGINAVRCTL